MKTFEQHVEEVMRDLDFEKIHQVMKCLEWRYYTTDRILPCATISETRDMVRDLMETAYKMGKKKKNFCSSGGFEVLYNKKYDYFLIKFVVTGDRSMNGK